MKMAKTIAICRGEDSSRVKEDHRLGSKRSVGEANTFRTFSGAEINADGSGTLRVIRHSTDGSETRAFLVSFNSEDNELKVKLCDGKGNLEKESLKSFIKELSE